MKNILLLVFAITFLTSGYIKAGDGDEKDPKHNISFSNTSRFLQDYKLAKKEFNYKTGKLVEFFVDFQLGASGTNANITKTPGSTGGDYTTTSKLGYTTGALVYLNLFNMVSFSTGLSFNGRSFGVTTPSYGFDTAQIKPGKTSYIRGNYLDIPLNFNIGGMLTEKFGLWFNGGPYFAVLLSTPSDNGTGLGYKNFDLGLVGVLTANYVFAYPFSVLLGTSFKYGGLNNLGNTAFVDKITTTNYSFFTGLRFQL